MSGRLSICWRRSIAGFIVLGTIACGGGRTGLLTYGEFPGNGDGAGGSTGAHSGGGSGGGTGGRSTSGATSFTSAEVQAALANCNLPHGPALNVAIPNDEKARLVGAWLLCPASVDAGPPSLFDPGILLAADGTFETLTAGQARQRPRLRARPSSGAPSRCGAAPTIPAGAKAA